MTGQYGLSAKRCHGMSSFGDLYHSEDIISAFHQLGHQFEKVVMKTVLLAEIIVAFEPQ